MSLWNISVLSWGEKYLVQILATAQTILNELSDYFPYFPI
jgi:hypothetical protein